jgi:hypothetical protein
LITTGKRLLLAGDERLLTGLPKGEWIGGTIPYFMAPDGGVHTADALFVTELPPSEALTIKRYTVTELSGIAADHPGHGFTVLLVPAFTGIHQEFANNVADYPGVFDRPLIGWIAGVALEDIGKVSPKVFDGLAGSSSDGDAVAMHVELNQDDTVAVNIINLFTPGNGDTISFEQAAFSVHEALVNGEPANFARYLTDHGTDTRLPLVGDYSGAMINVSIRLVDAAAGKVDFYAPVFPGIDYYIAAPVDDYVAGFNAQLHPDGPAPAFACNCILNYLYADLEGRSTPPIIGPMTFGEIAYMLLNQTAVYLTINREESAYMLSMNRYYSASSTARLDASANISDANAGSVELL